MADTLSEQQLAKLIEELKQLPPRRGYGPTLLQMAGFPHRETVWSNILAFYFDSTYGHGLGNTVFQVLMSLVGVEVDSAIEVRTRREEVLEDHKRLDLVLETDQIVVGIENKVYHELNNDLAAYRRHLDGIANGRHVYAFVLSLSPISEDQRVADWCFVTYKAFCAKLRERLKGNTARADDKYVIFLNDFVTSILNPGQGDVMDDQRLEFFKQHRTDIETLAKEVAALKQDMRRKIEALRVAIQAEPPTSRVPLQSGLLGPDEGLKDLIWNRVDIASDFALIIDIILEPDGWKISFFNYSGHQSKAEQWMKERGILKYHTIQNSYRNTKNASRAIIDDPAPSYDADIDQVREWAMKYLTQVLPQ